MWTVVPWALQQVGHIGGAHVVGILAIDSDDESPGRMPAR